MNELKHLIWGVELLIINYDIEIRAQDYNSFTLHPLN